MTNFDLGNGFTAICTYRGGAGSFFHFCTLYRDGKRIAKSQAKYFNRTWEAFTFQVVIKLALKNCNQVTDEEREALNKALEIEPKLIIPKIDN